MLLCVQKEKTSPKFLPVPHTSSWFMFSPRFACFILSAQQPQNPMSDKQFPGPTPCRHLPSPEGSQSVGWRPWIKQVVILQEELLRPLIWNRGRFSQVLVDASSQWFLVWFSNLALKKPHTCSNRKTDCDSCHCIPPFTNHFTEDTKLRFYYIVKQFAAENVLIVEHFRSYFNPDSFNG